MALGHAVKVIEQSHVSPSPSSEPRPTLPFTFFDVGWLHYTPVERFFLFHFPHPTSHFIHSQLPSLKSSLSLALARFYPLAGKVRHRPGSTDHFELSYVDGTDSVQLTVAETGADFSDLTGSHARDYTQIRPLIPELSESGAEKPLLAIQVTVFPNHGICVALAIHHVACDGVTSMHFVKSWAAACRSGGGGGGGGAIPVDPPVYDRSLIADPWGLYATLHKQLVGNRESKGEKAVVTSGMATYDDVVTAAFTLGPDQIRGLKKMVQAKAEAAKETFHCSTFVVSCAHVWVCLLKMRAPPIDWPAYAIFAVDWRGRLRIPAAYFGNCMGPCYAKAKVSDLVGGDGIFEAAKALGKGIEELKDGVFKTMDGFVDRFIEIVPYMPFSIAGSPRFGVYETDFGWGRPRKVEVPSIQKTGAISLSESREGGGIEIGLVLKKHQMDEFTAHFVNGLEFL